MSPLYAALLNAGVLLNEAVADGDTAGADRALNARDQILRQITESAARPSPEVRQQFQRQSEALTRLLDGQLEALGKVAAQVRAADARAVEAVQRYAPPTRSRLDAVSQ